MKEMKQIILKIQVQIQTLLHKLFKIKNKVSVSYLFTLPLILSKLDIQIDDTDSNLIQYNYAIFVLSLIALLSFIDIIGYMIVYVIIQRSNLEEKIKVKYLRLSKYITYYKNSNLIFVGIKVLTCLVCLLILVSSSLLMLYNKIS
jgi:hypothetical protein